MNNLKLLGRLQASDMVTLLLKSTAGEKLDYYILAKSINYRIVSSGRCDGNISGGIRMFNISLSSIIPLIDKGYNFRIQYSDNVLKFVTQDERMSIEPLCVEYNDLEAYVTIDKFLRFMDCMSRSASATDRIRILESEIEALESSKENISLMNLERDITSSSPFEVPKDTKNEHDIDSVLREKRCTIKELYKESLAVQSVDLKQFKTLALAAARYKDMISFCDDYAITPLKTSYVLQKGKCPVMALQGTLLYNLMNYGDGDGFYWFENGLVFTIGEEEKTTVFLEKYLPNLNVDSTIVTRGAVHEKYSLNMKSVLSITQVMKSKFPYMTFDMGEGKLILENDKNEILTAKFDVEDAQTLQLKKLMRGEEIQGSIDMAKISIPKEVQSLLSLFRGQVTIYIKAKKIIFQSEKLFLVFGR